MPAPSRPPDARHEEGSGPDETLSHVDGTGRARMVNVTAKPWTRRRALARCRVDVSEATIRVLYGRAPHGASNVGGMWAEVSGAARVAGIQAAKKTAELIPLCHPLNLSDIQVRLSVRDDGNIDIEGEAEVIGPTGVEMEALTACTVAALTVAAAVRSVDPEVSIEELGLWSKSGGRSGTWIRS